MINNSNEIPLVDGSIALVDEKQKQIWLEQNKEAIEIYNRSIEENVVFGD